MDSNFVKSLGKLQPVTQEGNSIAVSSVGDLVVITGDGNIKYANARKNTGGVEATFSKLSIEGISEEEILQFSNISFNAENSLILLWSTSKIGFVEIPSAFLKDDAIDSRNSSEKCVFTNIFDDSNSNVEISSSPIVKACFHPLNSQHVVILSERESLRIVDVRNMRTKKISLSADLKFSSFSFGPDIDWMNFTIFLLTNRGEVYAVCPIIPDGTLVPRQTVNDLWSWVDGHANTSRTESSRQYVEAIKVYLLQTLGPPTDAISSGYDVSDDASPTGSGLFVRAGEMQFGAESSSEFPLQAYDSVSSPFMDGISGNSLLVQGPLVIERGQEDVKRTTAANDICVPIVGNAVSGGAAAPVLVVSFGSGEVDFYLIDAQDSSSGYVGPAWRPIDRNRSLLATTAPSLLLVETIAVQQLETTSEVKKDKWKLLPDPVMSHYIHVTNFTRSQSYLLSSAWLRKALEDMSTASTSGGETFQGDETGSVLSYSVNGDNERRGRSGSNLFGEEHKDSSTGRGLNGDEDEEEEEVSYCIPVFAVTADSAVSTSSSDSQSASREQKTSEAAFPSGVSLNGMAVLSDPLVGHVAIFRTSSGLVSAVNLTVHSKLCELQATLSNIVTETDQLSSIKQQLTHATSEEGTRWRHSQQLVLRIATGLKNLPVIESKTTDNKKLLIEAAQNLERDVVLPMNELSQSTLFHFDILQETLRSQVQILEGPADSTSATNAAKKSGDAVSLNSGLKSLIASLVTEHDALVQRVEKITERMAQQKENAEMHLSLAISQRSKMTRAEVLYKQQLRDWSATIAQMSAQIDSLRLLAKPAMRITPTIVATDSSSASTSTPVKSQVGPSGLYSPSPIGAQGYTPVSGYRSQQHTVQSQTRYGVTSSAIKSLYPPQTPEPNSPMSSRFTAGSVASHTTPRPPLKSVTDQSSSSSSFMSPGYNTKFLTMQSPAAFRRPVGGAGQTAQAPGRTPQKAAPLVLNQGDQSACNELLGAQTELLSEAEERLRGLEERLKAVILSRN